MSNRQQLEEFDAFIHEARERFCSARSEAEEQMVMASVRKRLSTLPAYLLAEWGNANGFTDRKLAEIFVGNIARQRAEAGEELFDLGELVDMVERGLQVKDELDRIVAGVGIARKEPSA